MEKQVVKLESLLTVISPQQTVRILDDTKAQPDSGENIEAITKFKGTAVKAFREFAGHGATIKHVSPELERKTDAENPRYVMHVYIYPGK